MPGTVLSSVHGLSWFNPHSACWVKLLSAFHKWGHWYSKRWSKELKIKQQEAAELESKLGQLSIKVKDPNYCIWGPLRDWWPPATFCIHHFQRASHLFTYLILLPIYGNVNLNLGSSGPEFGLLDVKDKGKTGGRLSPQSWREPNSVP